jgi:hypothetical protein
MRMGVARLTVTLLVVGGVLAASFLWTVERRTNESVGALADSSRRLARMSETITGIGTAQRSYVAPGQLDEPWFERSSALLDQLSLDIGQAPADLRSPGAGEAVQALAESAEALGAADDRTRQNLGIGQDMMASDVVFSDGQNIIDTMIRGLRELQAAEQQTHEARLTSLGRQRWAALGVLAVVWTLGLVSLTRRAAPTAVAVAEPTLAEPVVVPVEASGAGEGSVAGDAPPDLAAVAALCTDLSRVTSPSALPDLLGRAARILDASGLILWISAGEQLFPVMGHGYAPEVLARLAPLARQGDNAAAAAWRSGQLTVVESTGPSDNGAIVAPVLGLDECVGVLAIEVGHGVEGRPVTRALAAVIAAQLATVVPSWPAASLTEPGDVEPEGTSVDGSATSDAETDASTLKARSA